MSKVEQRGNFAVLRDKDGKITTAVSGNATKRRETWRSLVRALTHNGLDQFEVLVKLSTGQPIEYTNPHDGSTAIAVPGVEVMRQAAKDVIEFLHGKAVAQTEVSKAEEEAITAEKLRTLNDAQLAELAKPLLEAVRVEADNVESPESITERLGFRTK